VLAEVEDLTDYAVVFRYLDAPWEPDEEEATRALEIARRFAGGSPGGGFRPARKPAAGKNVRLTFLRE